MSLNLTGLALSKNKNWNLNIYEDYVEKKDKTFGKTYTAYCLAKYLVIKKGLTNSCPLTFNIELSTKKRTMNTSILSPTDLKLWENSFDIS